jgi:hypothetical protein
MFAAPQSLSLSRFSKKYITKSMRTGVSGPFLRLFAVQGTGPRSAPSGTRRSGILVMKMKVLERKTKK